MRRLQ
jgi:hypothetical protein